MCVNSITFHKVLSHKITIVERLEIGHGLVHVADKFKNIWGDLRERRKGIPFRQFNCKYISVPTSYQVSTKYNPNVELVKCSYDAALVQHRAKYWIVFFF